KQPSVHSQLAVVTDNVDPKGMGRVKVKFFWMQEVMESYWMRVMMPDAGAGEQHPQNRGHVFIPEVGDQVIVGFERMNPNCPFVMGGLFHGANGTGGGENNDVKSITTRSGHMLKFDDAANAESITIIDKYQNVIFIDTANKKIRISAQETIDIEAKNINIRATEKIYQQAQNMETQVQEDKVMGVGNALKVTAESTYSLHTTDLTETVEGSKTVEVTNSLDVTSSEASILAQNGDMNVQGAGKATFKGGSDVDVSKG
ncbi:MAG: phage baseplate assembly protein V, partial [Bacteroidota bacterium]